MLPAVLGARMRRGDEGRSRREGAGRAGSPRGRRGPLPEAGARSVCAPLRRAPAEPPEPARGAAHTS